jgi:hypothetical protein
MNKVFTKSVSKDQARDTGMAVVLVLLLVGAFMQNLDYTKVAIVALILTMTIPGVYKYLAIIWFGFSRLLGIFVSRIILTLVFFLVVTPVGLLRKLLGYDTLKLKEFKKNRQSVMQIRDITFNANDINKPY